MNVITAYSNTKEYIHDNHAFVDQIFNDFFPWIDTDEENNANKLLETIKGINDDSCAVYAVGYTNWANIDFIEKSLINEREIAEQAFKTVSEEFDWWPESGTYQTLEAVIKDANNGVQGALDYIHHIKNIIVRDYQDLIISKFNHELQA